MGLVVLIFIIVIVFVIVYNNMKEQAKAREVEKASQDRTIADQGIRVDKEYTYTNSLNTHVVRFITDGLHQRVYISQTSSAFSAIPFSEIIGCEILTDSEVTGGVGRAVVGGVIAGGAGAIVGATTAKKQIMSYRVVIYRNAINDPSFTIPLINKKTKTTDPDYKEAVKFANNINASIKAILDKKQNVEVTESRPQHVMNIDPAAEIRKYKSLLDDGIITQEEFEQKKKNLLKL